LFFFFFQAEDGIRDFHVTGVQTCALPIFPPSPRRRGQGVDQHRRRPPSGTGGGRGAPLRQPVHRGGHRCPLGSRKKRLGRPHPRRPPSHRPVGGGLGEGSGGTGGRGDSPHQHGPGRAKERI